MAFTCPIIALISVHSTQDLMTTFWVVSEEWPTLLIKHSYYPYCLSLYSLCAGFMIVSLLIVSKVLSSKRFISHMQDRNTHSHGYQCEIPPHQKVSVTVTVFVWASKSHVVIVGGLFRDFVIGCLVVGLRV